MDYFDLIVDGPFQQVQKLLQDYFYYNGFRITRYDIHSGIAQRGSKGMNIVGGALAQYYEIRFQLIIMPDRSICVRIFKANSGLWGGIIGVCMVEEKYQGIIDELSYFFSAMV
jgi:hypothetical protein